MLICPLARIMRLVVCGRCLGYLLIVNLKDSQQSTGKVQMPGGAPGAWEVRIECPPNIYIQRYRKVAALSCALSYSFTMSLLSFFITLSQERSSLPPPVSCHTQIPRTELFIILAQVCPRFLLV